MPEIRGFPFPFPHLSFLVENPPSSKKHEQLPTTARALIIPIMNVTLQLPDDLCTAAQQRAGVESKTLASWFTDLLRRELRQPEPQPLSLLERLGDTEYADLDIPLPDRKEGKVREIHFEA